MYLFIYLFIERIGATSSVVLKLFQVADNSTLINKNCAPARNLNTSIYRFKLCAIFIQVIPSILT